MDLLLIMLDTSLEIFNIYLSLEVWTYLKDNMNLRASIPRSSVRPLRRGSLDANQSFRPFTKKGKRFKDSSEIPHEAKVINTYCLRTHTQGITNNDVSTCIFTSKSTHVMLSVHYSFYYCFLLYPLHTLLIKLTQLLALLQLPLPQYYDKWMIQTKKIICIL